VAPPETEPDAVVATGNDSLERNLGLLASLEFVSVALDISALIVGIVLWFAVIE